MYLSFGSVTRQAILIVRRFLRPIKRTASAVGLWTRGGELDNYLSKCRGVIHIGANRAQERDKYQSLGLAVVWIEAIPFLYQSILKDLACYRNQLVIQALITD